jgi:hypothetical protein
MEKSSMFEGIAVVSLISILFAPQRSRSWVYLLSLSILFGIIWFFVKD